MELDNNTCTKVGRTARYLATRTTNGRGGQAMKSSVYYCSKHHIYDKSLGIGGMSTLAEVKNSICFLQTHTNKSAVKHDIGQV